jgi:two-component system, LuxR family, response regulator FixJ
MDPETMSAELEVVVVDDDAKLRDSLDVLLSTAKIKTSGFASAEDFLKREAARAPSCVLLDVRLPGMSGIELLTQLNDMGSKHVVVMITGHGDIPMAVSAMRAGAFHFAEKPFDPAALLNIVGEALARLQKLVDTIDHARDNAERYAGLSARERQVLDLLVEGRPSKVIAYDLGISTRTAEHHRSAVMKKMAANSLSHLVRMALDLQHRRG